MCFVDIIVLFKAQNFIQLNIKNPYFIQKEYTKGHLMDQPEQRNFNTNDITIENHTLYIKELNDKVKKEGSTILAWHIELKVSLFFLFSQYGTVLDIVTKKSENMRGQAFVVFQNIKSAVRAKQDLDQYMFFDKKMVSFISFSFNTKYC